ncbi:MAG: cupin domain-containing protein [Oscillospiraceae bacterium]|jgi:mannose-6-phosphate isomerase-like protein (cupin superfamily)|nr:cupin domain-containing protein [Oscillospiraceae bacterium]
MTELDTKIIEIAGRIREMRLILDISEERMAQVTGSTLEEYRASEAGVSDFSFTFLHHCAEEFGIDMTELVTGEQPKLTAYTVVRKGKGLPIRRRHDLNYEHLAFRLRDKMAEPFLVTAPWFEEEQHEPMRLSSHSGQEFDYVLTGSIEVVINGHTEILSEGDTIYYDSHFEHGLRAYGGKECTFIAVVIRDGEDNK